MTEVATEVSKSAYQDLLEKIPPRKASTTWLDRIGNVMLKLSVNKVTREILATKGDIRKLSSLTAKRDEADAYAAVASSKGNEVLHREAKDVIGKVDALKNRLAEPRCRRMIEACQKLEDMERMKAYVSACGLMYGVMEMVVVGMRQIQSGGLFYWLATPKNRKMRDVYWDFEELHSAMGNGGLMNALQEAALSPPKTSSGGGFMDAALERAEAGRLELKRQNRDAAAFKRMRPNHLANAAQARREAEDARRYRRSFGVAVEDGGGA